MPQQIRMGCALLFAALFLPVAYGAATDVTDLRSQVEALRKEVANREIETPPLREVDSHIQNCLGTGNDVVTRGATLEIGGLLQVWAYSIRNDGMGLLNVPAVIPGPTGAGALNNNQASNDSFRIRRAEIRFNVDVNCNISAHVSIDPAREATSFPSFPSNQGTGISGDSDVSFFGTCDCAGQTDPRALESGRGAVNRMLQDAYISYHDYVPHHDFAAGQMIRHLGLEGSRDSGDLDFVERAMITQPAELRDLGVQAHGTWFDDRIQYWIGAFDGAGTAFQQRQNRADDNDQKDVVASIQGRPLWNGGWGNLELGYSIMEGRGGETTVVDPLGAPLNGLDRHVTTHLMQYAYASYALPCQARGMWVRGEWGNIRDRFAPGEVVTGNAVSTTTPRPFNIQGWYVATGYKLGESAFADRLPCSARKLEFLFRYDVMQNIFFHDLVLVESRLDVFKTSVYTAGLNYYVSGNNVKLQLNYNWVREPDASKSQDDRQFRAVRNDNAVLNLQVEF